MIFLQLKRKEMKFNGSVSGWRNGTLFVVGIFLIIHEAVIREGPERPALLILYAGMVGLPAFLKADEKREIDK